MRAKLHNPSARTAAGKKKKKTPRGAKKVGESRESVELKDNILRVITDAGTIEIGVASVQEVLNTVFGRGGSSEVKTKTAGPLPGAQLGEAAQKEYSNTLLSIAREHRRPTVVLSAWSVKGEEGTEIITAAAGLKDEAVSVMVAAALDEQLPLLPEQPFRDLVKSIYKEVARRDNETAKNKAEAAPASTSGELGAAATGSAPKNAEGKIAGQDMFS